MKQNRDTQIGERARATVAARAAADAAKRSRKNKTVSSDSSTGGSDTVPATSERADFLKELAKRNATPGMARGGKAMAPPPPKTSKTKPTSDELERRYDKQREKDLLIMPEKPTGYKKGGKAKGKSFAATKFGAAMKKKSADTKGRAMMKFAKGGSIDGCAVKGKTKTSMIKMKNGGSC